MQNFVFEIYENNKALGFCCNDFTKFNGMIIK